MILSVVLITVTIITASVTAQDLVITQPSVNSTLLSGEPYIIQWTAALDPAGILIFEIWLSTTALQNVRLVAQNIPITSLSYTWNVDASIPFGSYTLSVYCGSGILYAGPFTITYNVSSSSSTSTSTSSSRSASRSTSTSASTSTLALNSSTSVSSSNNSMPTNQYTSSTSLPVIIGSACGGLAVGVIASVIIFIFFLRRRRQHEDRIQITPIYSPPHERTYSETRPVINSRVGDIETRTGDV